MDSRDDEVCWSNIEHFVLNKKYELNLVIELVEHHLAEHQIVPWKKVKRNARCFFSPNKVLWRDRARAP